MLPQTLQLKGAERISSVLFSNMDTDAMKMDERQQDLLFVATADNSLYVLDFVPFYDQVFVGAATLFIDQNGYRGRLCCTERTLARKRRRASSGRFPAYSVAVGANGHMAARAARVTLLSKFSCIFQTVFFLGYAHRHHFYLRMHKDGPDR